MLSVMPPLISVRKSWTELLWCAGQLSSVLRSVKVIWAWKIMKPGPGTPGTAICCLCSLLTFLLPSWGWTLKKTPILTMPQAKRLISASLAAGQNKVLKALEKLEYYIKRNYIAYKSHAKKKLKHKSSFCLTWNCQRSI